MINFDFKTTSIVDVLNKIILDAVKQKASDIHLDPMEDALRVRFRIDGLLTDYSAIPKEHEKKITTRLKLLANMNITESRLPQDGAIKSSVEDINLDLRVSVLPTNEGEKSVIRILDYTMSLGGLETLGFNNVNYKKMEKMMNVPYGIILVTGATGTGKSTTTYSMLQSLNKPDTNIITVEDPIEMNIEGINQVQVNSEIGLDFGTVLRSILRQDPNIILIGEIRDSETAQIAVRASITGHLVLSTIHTNNSLSTIERLLDMDVERYLLSSALTGIVSQKLARVLCPHCKRLRQTNRYEKKLFKETLNMDILEVFESKGCDKCTNGFAGRTAVQEVLLINDEIRYAMSNPKLEKQDLRELVYTDNVITMLADGLGKVVDGMTTFEEVYKLVEIDNVFDEEKPIAKPDAEPEEKEDSNATDEEVI